MQRRKFLAGAAGSLLFSFAPWQFAYGAQMVAVRMWPAPEYTRVTLEHDGPLQFEYFFVRSSNPVRFVIDIRGLEFTASLKRQIEAVKPDDPYIASIRIGNFKPGVVRLVMDLKREVRPEVFSLKPFGKFKNRLVIDIFPQTPTDTIGQILAGVDSTQGKESDPLGTLLANLNSKDPPGTDEKPKTRPVLPEKGAADGGKRPAKQSVSQRLVVVVDPGHGGEDPGAIGRGKTKEKDVVLTIGKILRDLINKEPNMRAIMTRSSDHFVPLGRRVQIAQKANAHLLISIHADAWVKQSARGSSVFALSQRGASSRDARWLADRQNESDQIGGVNFGDVDRGVAELLVDLTGGWSINYSLGLGAAVLGEMKRINLLHKNKVEQAGFAVLKARGIPSILVETAFISNPTEEKLLRNRQHQVKIAEAILNGIRKQVAANPTIFNPD